MASAHPIRGSRVAVDSSVYFAAARSSRGLARDLLAWGMLGVVELAISEFVYEETEEHLEEKWPQGVAFFLRIKAAVGATVERPPESLVRRALDILDDPEDAPVVAGAAHARAQYLATYDRKHLLAKREEVRRAFGVEVATPEQILIALGLGTD